MNYQQFIEVLRLTNRVKSIESKINRHQATLLKLEAWCHAMGHNEGHSSADTLIAKISALEAERILLHEQIKDIRCGRTITNSERNNA